MKAFLDDNSTFSCECTGCSFVNKYHNHIITGNLKVITNNKLWKLFTKATKYRKNKTADYEKAKKSIITGIKLCI